MKRVFVVLLSLVLLATMFSFSRMPTAQATVEPGWPAGLTNTPRNPDDIFIDFESGIDGIQIESTIPSLKFTTTSGLNWRYADIQTGQYNVYPYGSQLYETNGNFFAWLGVTGDSGRIDFLGGGATYCSVLVSTYSGVTMDAYDSGDGFLSTSGWATNNTGTRTFTRLEVDAPSGKTIAYVIIHDTGNYWLMDDLCTDANKAVIPVPGRSIGSHGDKFDIVFVPDVDYGSPADIDTWLPTFLDHINHQIDERLGGAAPVTGNLDNFNFYYTRMQGTASTHSLPNHLTLYSPFADAYVIFHNAEFGDSTIMSKPSIYGAEGPVGRSFIHESGHGIFGVADEYDGLTSYFEPDPFPNICPTEAACRGNATALGLNPDDCWQFTTRQGGWWKIGTTEYIMFDGTRFANGWGTPAARHIQWVLDQYSASSGGGGGGGGGGAWEKSIWLNVQVSAGVFSLLEDSFVIDSSPNYLPGEYDFTAKVFSEGGGLLGEYGMNDPRRIIAESDYVGPMWLDSANFQLILPYFELGDRVDLIESATGSVVMSVDISQYATATADVTPPTADANGPYTVDEGSCVTLNGSGTDPQGLPLTYAWDLNGDGVFETPGQSVPFCAVDGPNTVPVALQVCNSAGLCANDTSTVTINNVPPTVGPITAPSCPIQPNKAITASASFTDPGILDTHTAVWDWGDGASSPGVLTEVHGSGSVAGSHAYTAAGVYTITLTVTDKDGGKGAPVLKSVSVLGNQVTVQLLDSNGNPLSGGIVKFYYGYNWHPFGTTDACGQASYDVPRQKITFMISYAGGDMKKSQDVSINPLVVFQTTKVTMKLLDSAGTTELSAGAQYQDYASCWHTFGGGTTTTTMELLPLKYNFMVSYAGASMKKSQDVGSNPILVFQTGKVHSDSGKCTQYYAAAWRTFTQNIELLPVSYKFRFSDGTPITAYTIVAGTVNHIH